MKDEAFRLVLVVACALFNDKGEVLVTQRPAQKSFAGFWEFPGGKIEKGETPEAALIRELKEEVNIDVEASSLKPFSFVSHSYDDFHLMMLLFKSRCYKGILEAREGQNYQFIAPKGLKTLSLIPADLEFLPLFEDDQIGFFSL